ncbi:MAG: FmdB family transcriptional regulator [Anaerolineae bacterium]|nr:MAG: FmdB family transcriptional regulator [Anaerolineae bacterium]
MPFYDFTCVECGTNFEKHIPYSSATQEITCPRGHHTVRRLYVSPQVIFKGGGWYITDHRKSNAPQAAGAANATE